MQSAADQLRLLDKDEAASGCQWLPGLGRPLTTRPHGSHTPADSFGPKSFSIVSKITLNVNEIKANIPTNENRRSNILSGLLLQLEVALINQALNTD